MKIEELKSNLKLLKSLSNRDMDLVKKIPNLKSLQKKFFNELINENIYFWDYGFLLRMEQIYLQYLHDYLLKENLFVGCERVCERIQTCVKLLDIIQSKNTPAHLNYNKNDSIEDIINNRNDKWELKKYVNIRNACRFLKEDVINLWKNREDKDWSVINQSHLYEIKAWYLYHKIRVDWMQGWWS